MVEELSTSFQESDPTVRRDGREIILASDRPGTLDGLDLWVATCERRTGRWSEPVPLGGGFNTPAFDAGPALSFRGTELYFMSAFRPENVGGPMFDIWLATCAKPSTDGDNDVDDDENDDGG